MQQYFIWEWHCSLLALVHPQRFGSEERSRGRQPHSQDRWFWPVTWWGGVCQEDNGELFGYAATRGHCWCGMWRWSKWCIQTYEALWIAAHADYWLTENLFWRLVGFWNCGRRSHMNVLLGFQGRLPVRWMAIESLNYSVYTTKSDV